MTSTGFIMVNGQDIRTIFEPYSGGTKATLTNFITSNRTDLNEIFDPNTGVDASATGFYTLNGIGERVDLNKVFMKAKTWSSYVVGGGNPLSTYISVVYDFSIDTATNGIYVGGSHTSTDYFNKRVAYTTPNNGWKQMAAGLTITNSGASAQVATTVIYGMYAVSSTRIYACGNFTKTGNTSLTSRTNSLSYFNGSGWTDMGVLDATYRSLHYKSEAEIYIGVLSVVIAYNANTRVSVNLGNIAPIYAVFDGLCAINSTNIYAGGYSDLTTPNKIRFYKYTFNGTSGTYTNLTDNNINGKINTIWAVDTANIYIGGIFTNAFGVSANYIVKYNGSVFSALTALNAPNGEVINIHFLSNAKIYVTYTSGGTYYLSQYISNTWTILLSATNKFIVKQINTQLYVCGVNTSYTNVKTNTTITTNSGVLFIDL